MSDANLEEIPEYRGLNPYSNGICSMRMLLSVNHFAVLRLNPYSNGICSMRDR